MAPLLPLSKSKVLISLCKFFTFLKALLEYVWWLRDRWINCQSPNSHPSQLYGGCEWVRLWVSLCVCPWVQQRVKDNKHLCVCVEKVSVHWMHLNAYVCSYVSHLNIHEVPTVSFKKRRQIKRNTENKKINYPHYPERERDKQLYRQWLKLRFKVLFPFILCVIFF